MIYMCHTTALTLRPVGGPRSGKHRYLSTGAVATTIRKKEMDQILVLVLSDSSWI